MYASIHTFSCRPRSTSPSSPRKGSEEVSRDIDSFEMLYFLARASTVDHWERERETPTCGCASVYVRFIYVCKCVPCALVRSERKFADE